MGEPSTLPAAVSPREQRQLIGKFDDETKAHWSALMNVLDAAGLLELTPDVMQADLVVRAYQRMLQLDEIEFETLQKIAGVSNNPHEQWYREQVKLLNDFLVTGALKGSEYADAMAGLTNALMARLSNTHNLLNVISKARFQHFQALNKSMHYSALSRLARKAYGKSDGHDMERLQKVLREEADELDLASRGGSARVVDDKSQVEMVDAAFSEIDNADFQRKMDAIRKPATENPSE